MYGNLFVENKKIVGEIMKRASNHEALISSLKEVNKMISMASSLRAGKYKTELISLCRNAVRENNILTLINVWNFKSDFQIRRRKRLKLEISIDYNIRIFLFFNPFSFFLFLIHFSNRSDFIPE